MRRLTVCALLLAGCTAPSSLALQITSDLTATRDVDSVAITVSADGDVLRNETVALDAGSSLGRARRVLDVDPITPGTYDVEITLHHADETVVSRSFHARVEGRTVRTVYLTRDCRTVTCGTDETCDLGRCVPRGCAIETPDECGPRTCASDAECSGAGTVACAPGTCSDTGACVAIPDDEACSTDAPVCDATLGCLPATATGSIAVVAAATAGARTVFIDATVTSPGSFDISMGVSPTRLISPDAAAVRALDGCTERATGARCQVPDLAPETMFFAYAVAERALATGTQVSNVVEIPVTTRAETMVLDFTSNSLPSQALAWVPDSVDDPASSEMHPAILYLHGGAEAVRADITCLADDEGLIHTLLTTPALARDFPFVVVAPHCFEPAGACPGWTNRPPLAATTLAIDSLDAAIAMLPIDTHRVYVTGISYGGEGSFVVPTAFPTRFAASIPIGSTQSAGIAANICDMAGVAVWAFHNPDDTTAPHAASVSFLDALAMCPGAAPGHLTSLSCNSAVTGPHCGWNEAYGGTHGDTFEGQTSVFDWFLLRSLP